MNPTVVEHPRQSCEPFARLAAVVVPAATVCIYLLSNTGCGKFALWTLIQPYLILIWSYTFFSDFLYLTNDCITSSNFLLSQEKLGANATRIRRKECENWFWNHLVYRKFIWDDGIKDCLKYLWWCGVEWIHLAQVDFCEQVCFPYNFFAIWPIVSLNRAHWAV